MECQYQSFAFQLGIPLKTLGYRLLTIGSILLSRSSSWRVLDVRSVFFSLLRSIYRTHRQKLNAGAVRKRKKALRLTRLYTLAKRFYIASVWLPIWPIR